MQAEQLRQAQTAVRAPDDGVISARTATVGSMTQPGQELFRLIRGSRLEWRAEVSAADLGKLKPGVTATLTAPNGARIQGRVRMVAPTVDPQTLNGLVYVDLPVAETGNALRAGTFARGEFELGRTPAMSLPQSAVLLRDGFSYVFRLDDQNTVAQTKVAVGQRMGDQIEIVSGIAADTRVVASGAGFLADGDVVRVVDAPATASQNP
jgi:RND family efflux transporter MFP subunit